MEHHLELAITLVVAIGLAAQWLAWRFNLPAIVLLTAAGLAVGPGLGLVDPARDFGGLLRPLVALAVGVILFEGGFSLHIHEVRHTARAILRLITLGVALAWVLGAAAGHWIAGLSWPVAAVLGAILVITGPTVIGPLLRQARLQARPASFLKWEGIINDPVGALLAILTFEYLVHSGPASPLWQVAGGLLLAAGIAAALGGGGGYLLGRAFDRGVVPEFLKAPVLFATILLVYALANLVQAESGLLATTAMGLVMGNMRLASSLELRRFKEHIVVILISVLFVVLAADLQPGLLAALDWRAGAFVLAMLLAVRPLAAGLATVGAYMTWRERLLVAGVAPRGVVTAAMAGVLGPALVEQGYADGRLLLPLVFGVILLTVSVHGFTIRPLARWLGLVAARRDGVLIVGAQGWTVELAKVLDKLDIPVTVADSSWHRLRPARMAGLTTQSGELLSELGQQRLDLSGIGYLLAATDNDAYNALVCTRFAPELGRDRVFQLPTAEAEEGQNRAFSHTLRGRVAFSEEATFDRMMQRHYLGWTFQLTRLTDEFTYDDFLQHCPVNAENLLLVRDSGEVVFQSPEAPLEPANGDSIVCYRPARSERERAAGSTQQQPTS
ncbi:MAG TPA: sodium:proton antiporter [Gammaproteobacteria bacterium]|nr:sodium:proton antiporter [Gammaproteobacteria bacterium]